MQVCADSNGFIQALVVTRVVDEELWIHAVYTDAELRRKGLATHLVKSAIEMADCKSVLAALSASNLRAHALFSHMGFKHVVDILAWPSWETSCALQLSVAQGLSVDLLVTHPPEEREAQSIAAGIQECRSLEALAAALAECSPAPPHLQACLPGERRLVSIEHTSVTAALSRRHVWLLPRSGGGCEGVLATGVTPRGMRFASVVAGSAAALEAALIAARALAPRSCRFYALTATGPLALMGDQFSLTQVWERQGSTQKECA